MIKLKKLLAGVLGAAMVLSSMSLTAFADDDKMPTIDTTKQGSLTIHKYEYNGDAGSTGTGSEDDSVPNDAAPLAGVTFRITKIAELSTYYGTDGAALPTLEQGKALAQTVQAAAKADGASEEAKAKVQEDTTDDNGVITFKDLSLGLYYVEETAAPAQITGKTQDFLVSIPMTNSTEDDWLYDVHVFPKNSSTYAGVTLVKKGKVGDDAAAALKDATFVLQKKETDNKWTTVTKNNKDVAIGTNGTLTTNSEGKISVSDLAPGTYRFVETGVPTKSGYIMNGADTKEFVIADGTVDGIAAGSVVINGTVVDTTQKPIEVINYKPDTEKEVKDREDASWGDDSDYSAGDTVPYRVTVDVPANVADLVDFTLTDTMEHQTYTAGSLKIYSDADFTNQILNSLIPEVSGDSKTWNIAFNSKNDDGITSALSAYAGQSVYIYFETVLGTDAVTTSAGNDNTVKLEYSNKILPTTNTDGNPNEPGTPKKDEISDQATVYTFEIAVEKVDASDASKKLADVTFDLYRKTSDTASDLPAKGLPKGTYEKVASLTTDTYGKVSAHGLENGEYYLVETKTNDGYNLLKEPVKVEIAAEYETTTSKSTVTGTDGVTKTTTTVTNTKFDKIGSNGVISTQIKNSKGFTLPTTGGMGSIIFIVGGIAIALAGLLIILASRKKTAAE